MKRAFTLIELLVVIAIIAILAAILFPVFAQAKSAAKKSVDLSNLKQIGTSTMLYVDDYDDALYPHRFNCNTQGDPKLAANVTCPAYLAADGTTLRPEAAKLSGGAEQRYSWVYMLQPYTKNYDLFKNPGGAEKFVPGDKVGKTCYGDGCLGTNYGGQNSYGHNDLWLSPSGTYGGGGSLPSSVATTSIPRVASTIMIVDASYYGAVPDVSNASGILNLASTSDGTGAKETAFSNAQGAQYVNYWKNVGGANWSYRSDFASYTPAKALVDGAKLHGGNLNAQFADGHAKSMPYKRTISDICLWTTDLEGAHPNCG